MKKYEDDHYDVVIIGSGLGGLACGVMFAKEGKSVCILEKNQQIGGTLQTFSRDKVIFDSGVHYVGGMDEGQNMHQLFKYLGILDKLKYRKMDMDMFEAIILKDDDTIYKYAQGYENFIQTLSAQFPGEEENLRRYCDKIKKVCSTFPLYNLREGDYIEKLESLGEDASSFIASITDNPKLRSILGATNMLYAGEENKSPLYVHALIINSYIESSYRFVDGGSQIGKYLGREITSRGGVILKHANVVKIVEKGGVVDHVLLEDGRKFRGDIFISNLHPHNTMKITESTMIKKVYRHRMEKLDNTISTFYINAVMKKDAFPYLNHNYYCFDCDNVWRVGEHTEENWPLGYAFYCSASSKSEEFSDAVTIMAYMRYDEVRQWENTFNTVAKEGDRGASYEEFKIRKAEKLLDVVEKKFPRFRDAIESYYCASPLTARDYLGTDDGSLYGFSKDYADPIRTFISPKTKIPNLLLTGQNLNLHGVLGVTVSAVVTASQILGMSNLVKKIQDA